MKIRLALVGMIVLSSIVVNAGQAWFGAETGKPYRWQNGVIEWIYEPGDLAASVSNAKAVEWVNEAFDKWAKASLYNSAAGGAFTTVDLHPSNAGSLQSELSADPDSADFYLDTILNSKYKPTIVFDKDGSIITHLCKKYLGCDPNEIMAYTMINEQIGDLDSKTRTITHGVTILNGTQINKTGIDDERFKASLLHELGHLLGLDHSGLNDGYATKNDGKLKPTLQTNMEMGLTTMYPVNLHKEQNSLHNDDVMAISTLYPSEDFKNHFCWLIGNVVDSNGVGVQGVAVEVRTKIAADFATDAYSTMTGVNYPIPTRNGQYYMFGLVPGKKYSVGLRPLPIFQQGSSIGRFGKETNVKPPAFMISCEGISPDHCDAGLAIDVTANGGATYEVSCDKGGQKISMDTVTLGGVSMDAKYSTAKTPAIDEPQPPPAAAASGKSGCTLIR